MYLHYADDGPIEIQEILDTRENTSGVKEGLHIRSKQN